MEKGLGNRVQFLSQMTVRGLEAMALNPKTINGATKKSF